MEKTSPTKAMQILFISMFQVEITYDQTGYDYWLSNLNNGVETKYELLLGFSDSLENNGLFSEITGFYEIYDLLNLKLNSLLELKITSHSLL